MAQTVIKMNYPAMQKMASVFSESEETLNGTIADMNKIVDLLEQGALKGKPGDALEQAVRETLIPKLKFFSSKMNELCVDIQGAMQDMRSHDAEGAGKF